MTTGQALESTVEIIPPSPNPSGQNPTVESPPPSPADTRRYLPRAFGLSVSLPDDQIGHVEATVFIAETNAQGNRVDIIGTATLADKSTVDFETFDQLAQVTKWPVPTMQEIMKRIEELLRS